VEVILLSLLESGAVPELGGAAVLAGGASGVVVVLATEEAAGAAPVVSGVPPALGGSVALGAVVAPRAGYASVDARSSSSLAVHGVVSGVAVVAGLGPGVVCPVFLLFLPFFSSFFSSVSLERAGGWKIRKKVSQRKEFSMQGHSRGVSLHPSSFAQEARGCRWWSRGFARRLLAGGGLSLRSPAGAFIVELGAALRLQAGLAPLLLQVSQGGRVNVSPGG
jgi:hypothetical protein